MSDIRVITFIVESILISFNETQLNLLAWRQCINEFHCGLKKLQGEILNFNTTFDLAAASSSALVAYYINETKHPI